MTAQTQDDTFKEMSILDHLNELRIRVTHAMIGLVIGTLASIAFTGRLLKMLEQTYCKHFKREELTDLSDRPLDDLSFVELGDLIEQLSDQCTMAALAPTETIEAYFKIALTGGLVLSMPWIVYQLWKFIKPGLYKNEKQQVLFFIPVASLLFLTGVAFAWFILLPPSLQFLTSFLSDVVENYWRISEYVGFVTKFLVWIGLSFETPLIMYFIGRFGLVTSQALRKNWRFAIVGIAVLAAIITPSVDPVTMSLTMFPLGLLYAASIVTTKIGYSRFEKTGIQLEPDLEEEA